MSKPKHLRVSAIIPTYNRALLVQAAIQCLKEQTQPPYEIIVVDDGSTDNTQAVLATYGDTIRVIQQTNQGLASARNSGLRAATGDAIILLDSDDLLAPTSIEERTTILENFPQYGVVYSNVMMMDMEGHELALYTQIHPPKSRPTGQVFTHYTRYNLMPVHAFMFRRECVEKSGEFDQTLLSLEDYDFWIRVAAQFEFFYLDKPLAYYRVHETMMTFTKRPEMTTNDLNVHSRIFEMPMFHNLSTGEKYAAYRTHGTRYAMIGQMLQSREWYKKAISDAPGRLSSYLLYLLTYSGQSNFQRVVKFTQRLRGTTLFATQG